MPTSLAPPTLEHKRVPFRMTSLKAAGGGWEISGYASVFGPPPDSYGDVVAPGAFAQSIATRPTKFLFEHRTPIGKQLEIREDARGLFGRWSVVDTTDGTDAYKLAKAGVLDSLSIGYVTDEFKLLEDGTRVLTKVSLYEVSCVAMPAQPLAVITDVKSGGSDIMSVAARMAARGVRPLDFPTRPQSIGERVAASPDLKAFAAGRLSEASVNLDGIGLKALVTSLRSPVDLRADLTEQPTIALTLVDVLPVYPTESNRVSIPRIGAVTNAAAPVAEATATTGASGLKPESALAFLDGTLPVETLAHWLTVTRVVLDDAGQAAAIIDTELLLGLKLAVENQYLNGNGTTPQLAGILGLAGIGTVAVAASNYLAAVLSAMAQVRTASRRAPTVICLSSAAWVAVASAAAPGLLGISARGLPTLLGAEVVQSDVLPAGTGLVGVASTAPVFERQQAGVTLGLVNDQFVRNAMTMLAEVRLALVVSRQNAWCKITGLP